MNCVLSAKATVLFIFNSRRMLLLVFIAIVIALFAFRAFKRDEFSYFGSHNFPSLFNDIGYGTGANCPSALADGKAQVLVHGYGRYQLHLYADVVARHNKLYP